MKIKSPFSDYYDSVQSYGQDDIIYIRYPKEINNKEIKKYNILHRFHKNNYGYKTVQVGFCGKIYTGYRFYSLNPSITYLTKYLYTAKAVENFYDKMGWNKKRDSDLLSYSLLSRIIEQESISRNIEEHPIFLKYRTPIFTHEVEKVYVLNNGSYEYIGPIVINNRLCKYDFQTVFPTQLAFQEIRMYLSLITSPEKPIPHIDDVTMAEAKGFDKWSFRKEPANRKV
jgi:hypothetical protein